MLTKFWFAWLFPFFVAFTNESGSGGEGDLFLLAAVVVVVVACLVRFEDEPLALLLPPERFLVFVVLPLAVAAVFLVPFFGWFSFGLAGGDTEWEFVGGLVVAVMVVWCEWIGFLWLLSSSRSRCWIVVCIRTPKTMTWWLVRFQRGFPWVLSCRVPSFSPSLLLPSRYFDAAPSHRDSRFQSSCVCAELSARTEMNCRQVRNTPLLCRYSSSSNNYAKSLQKERSWRSSTKRSRQNMK